LQTIKTYAATRQIGKNLLNNNPPHLLFIWYRDWISPA